ncbi:MAG: hypothetical protein Q8R28_14200 [Dehalococcoidia bacterium]|nr:hypothetical protein [Dehalococcoidia bacterium]
MVARQTLEEMAEARNAAFLARYKVPNYDILNCPAEAKEEMADAWNYITAEMAKSREHPRYPRRVDELLSKARRYVEEAWDFLEAYEEARDA